MNYFSGPSPASVWKDASRHLLSIGGHQYHIFLEYPADGAADESPLRSHCPRGILGVGYDRARDVANTIFPTKTWLKTGSRGPFYSRYLEAHSRSRNKKWGTYFQRLIAYGDTSVNQLERMIVALNTWPKSYRAAFVAHTAHPERDGPRVMGAPCLQYLQLNCPDSETIDLSATFRNHDYSNKVLGNLFGLARLLHFVCSQTGKTAGSVLIHSVHGYLDAPAKRQLMLIGT